MHRGKGSSLLLSPRARHLHPASSCSPSTACSAASTRSTTTNGTYACRRNRSRRANSGSTRCARASTRSSSGLAWFAWHGLFAWLFAAIVALEYAITLVHSAVEDDTRRLSRVERATHMLLGFTTGGYFALIGWHAFTQWRIEPTALVPTAHGGLSVVLAVLAAGVVAWAVRDALAARRLLRSPRRPRSPAPAVPMR